MANRARRGETIPASDIFKKAKINYSVKILKFPLELIINFNAEPGFQDFLK